MRNKQEMREKVLLEPLSQGADTLKIISGYSSHAMASWHISQIRELCGKSLNIELIVGMCLTDALFRPMHEGFKDIMSTSPFFTCRYVIQGGADHSKTYLWEKDGRPLAAYTGSANYTQSAFFGTRRETLTEYDLEEAKEVLDEVEADSMLCTDPDIEKHIVIADRPQKLIVPSEKHEKLSAVSAGSLGLPSVSLPLTDRTGQVPARSGLNWGQRDSRNRDQAYLSVPADTARSDFFPERGIYFTALTDDNISLTLNRGQDNGKGITTPLDNSQLGAYIRKRLGLAGGAFVTREDLDRYGRTDVTFYKLDDEMYFMDFSRPEGRD